MTRITDLEKFALEEIFRPYRNMIPEIGDKRLTKLPCKLKEIPQWAEKYPEWWKCVKGRIDRIGFRFPGYIVHPLVGIICKQRPHTKKGNTTKPHKLPLNEKILKIANGIADVYPYISRIQIKEVVGVAVCEYINVATIEDHVAGSYQTSPANDNTCKE